MKTQKILSLILAVLMVVSLIPATMISAVAEDATQDATQETVGGVTYNTVQIYGGPKSPSVTGWDTYNTDLSKLEASGLNAADAAGILIDVKWNKASLSKVQIKLKLDNAAGSLGALGGTNGAYYGNDGYASGVSATNNWLDINGAAWEGTIFFAKETFDTWSKSDFSVFRFAFSAGQSADNLHATFSNVRLAYYANEASEGELTHPELPEGYDVTVSKLYSDDLVWTYANHNGKWPANVVKFTPDENTRYGMSAIVSTLFRLRPITVNTRQYNNPLSSSIIGY